MKLILSLIVALVPAFLIAQGTAPAATTQTTPAAASQPAQVEEDNYLDRLNAYKGMESLRLETQKDIRKLGMVVGNFGAEVPGSEQDLRKIRDKYEEASVQYYQQKYIRSRLLLDETRVGVMDLYKKFNENYGKKTEDIMIECSKAVAGMELSSTPGSGNESEWSTGLIRNQAKLRTAYGHVVIAKDMARDKRYSEAISEYRLAKAFGISLLKTIDDDPAKSKAVDEKYRMDMIDANGGGKSIFSQPATASTPATTTPAANQPK